MNAWTEIEQRLREGIGLDTSTVGTSAVQFAVRIRVEKLGLRSTEDYVNHLAENREEFQALVEEVVISETWFFRDHEPFVAFARWATNEWLPANSTEPLRVLSLPCATGEEPYSIAMMLLDACVPASRFIVDAVDISERALMRAQRGVYRRNSFRTRDLNFRERHFTRDDDGFVVSETVRKQVNFRSANILAADFQPPSLFYDAIFCRNMLIYFEVPAQKRVIDLLTRRLSPGGVLFVGHAEQNVFAETEFVSARMPMAFAFQRRKLKPLRLLEVPNQPTRFRKTPLEPQRSNSRTTTPSRTNGRRMCEPSADKNNAVPSLAEAEALANQGRFDEASRICNGHLKACGDSAEAFHLLGLINDAGGRSSEAIDSYRKALYLEPRHADSLMHLALLTEKSGDAEGARRLRQRAERAEEKTV